MLTDVRGIRHDDVRAEPTIGPDRQRTLGFHTALLGKCLHLVAVVVLATTQDVGESADDGVAANRELVRGKYLAVGRNVHRVFYADVSILAVNDGVAPM